MPSRTYPSTVQHTIAVPQVVQILQGAQARGLDWERVLRRSGIAPALLDSPLSRVTQAQYARLVFELRRLTRDELWGLCEQPLPIGSFALGCRMLIHCGTLGEAMRSGARYYHQQLHDFAPRLQVGNGVATLRLSSRRAPDARLIYAQRTFMFFSFGLCCWLVARRIPLLDVVYTQAAPGLRSDASRLFQAPVHYEPDWMGFRFDAHWLDLPVVQNPDSLDDFLRQAPASLLVRYRDQTSLTERIRRLLRRYLSEDMPSLEEVSSTLAMTPQTLRRRLQREGQGYQAIKDSLRRDVAVEYLSQPDMTLIDIANRLGFSEASTFHRAFKGWTGLAPGVYRQRRLQGRNGSAEGQEVPEDDARSHAPA
ncbi:MAG: AraC family transcriptional regulator [Burkholderiaceae bacterium]